jgi:hypothetical protein
VSLAFGARARQADLLALYPAAIRAQIHAQARRLAELMADAIPPDQKGGLGRAHWEDVLYELILAECRPEGPRVARRLRELALEKGGGER